jgi:hypothetical protein
MGISLPLVPSPVLVNNCGILIRGDSTSVFQMGSDGEDPRWNGEVHLLHAYCNALDYEFDGMSFYFLRVAIMMERLKML